MWARPARVTAIERRYAHRRFPMKSYRVWTKIWSIVGSSEGQGLEAPPTHVDEVEDEPGEEDGGEEARDDTDHEGHREAFHGPCPELIEDHPRHDHGDVGVDDGGESPPEAAIDGRAHRVPEARLIPDAVEDQDVRVQGHPDGEHDAGDTGEGEGGPEPGHACEQDQEVQEEGDVGHQAGEPVVDDHEEDHGEG